MTKEIAGSGTGAVAPIAGEIQAERQMLGGVHKTLKFSKEVPTWKDKATGIDVRNQGPIPDDMTRKDDLAVYPAGADPTLKLYLRSMKIGRGLDGRSIRAYTERERGGKREGEQAYVVTDYDTISDETGRAKGSTTVLQVYDKAGNLVREREHASDGLGLSPLVTKIVTKGIEGQIERVKATQQPKGLKQKIKDKILPRVR